MQVATCSGRCRDYQRRAGRAARIPHLRCALALCRPRPKGIREKKRACPITDWAATRSNLFEYARIFVDAVPCSRVIGHHLQYDSAQRDGSVCGVQNVLGLLLKIGSSAFQSPVVVVLALQDNSSSTTVISGFSRHVLCNLRGRLSSIRRDQGSL